jgi:hypothetical protein
MKIKEVIERVQSLYSKGAASDDTRLSSRHIYSKLISARSLLIKRELDKRKKLSQRSIEYLECIPLETASKYDCGFSVPPNCTVLKTRCKIPKAINSNYGDYIASVSTIDGSHMFSKSSWERVRYIKGQKYTSSNPVFYFKNDYLFLLVNKNSKFEDLKFITMGGVFEDALGFKCEPACSDFVRSCENLDEREFIVEDHLIDPIIGMAVQELLGVFATMPEDRENNSSERDKTNGSKPK